MRKNKKVADKLFQKIKFLGGVFFLRKWLIAVCTVGLVWVQRSSSHSDRGLAPSNNTGRVEIYIHTECTVNTGREHL